MTLTITLPSAKVKKTALSITQIVLIYYLVSMQSVVMLNVILASVLTLIAVLWLTKAGKSYRRGRLGMVDHLLHLVSPNEQDVCP